MWKLFIVFSEKSEIKRMYMSEFMYMIACKTFPFLTYRFPSMHENFHPTHTPYNSAEKILIVSFCYSLAFNEINALKGSSLE